MSKWTKFVAVALVATMAAACSDDGNGGSQIELSQQETSELFSVISSIFTEFADFSVANPGLSLSVLGILDEINETAACPQGGSVSVTGEDNSATNTVDFDADLDFNACQSQGWTLGGGLNFAGNGTSTETTLSVDFGISGTITAEAPSGASGSCTWDIDYSIEMDGQVVDVTVSGSICGESFSYST